MDPQAIDEAVAKYGIPRRVFFGTAAAVAAGAAIGVEALAASPAFAAPSNVLSFYARGNWQTGWKVVDAAHKLPHKGLDIRAAARQRIPLLRSGTVRAVGSSAGVGGYFFVQVGQGDFDVYEHQTQITVSVGQTVTQGSYVSAAAGSSDNHGTAWEGPHLHLGHSSTTGDPYQLSIAYFSDPAPVVASVLDGTATPPQQEEEEEMPSIRLAWVAASGGEPDRWVMMNLADGSYWGVPNQTQVTYLKAIGVSSDDRLQAPAILDNFTRLR